MTLSDDDVNRQIDHMIAFIKNESQEKIEEIYAKVPYNPGFRQGIMLISG